jgi:hypothetical protein
MSQEAIFIPFLGLMLLTLVVWLYMYYQRLAFLRRRNIDPQSVATDRQVLDMNIPDRVMTPSENLVNLFELPVLFYAACLYLYVTQQVDTIYLTLAYGYLGLRIVHSVIHCSYNRVVHRFLTYIASSILLWVLIIRAFIGAVSA